MAEIVSGIQVVAKYVAAGFMQTFLSQFFILTKVEVDSWQKGNRILT